MRTILVFLLLCTAARGELLSARLAGSRETFGSVTLPQDGLLVIRPIGASTDVFEWRVPDLDPSDVGTVFSLTEANAAEYGVDWQQVTGFFETPYQFYYRSAVAGFPSSFMPMRFAQYAPGGSVPTHRYQVDQVERIDFHLWELYGSPIGSIADTTHDLIFDGELIPIPEPSSLLLLLYGVTGFTRRRHGPVWASQV